MAEGGLPTEKGRSAQRRSSSEFIGTCHGVYGMMRDLAFLSRVPEAVSEASAEEELFLGQHGRNDDVGWFWSIPGPPKYPKQRLMLSQNKKSTGNYRGTLEVYVQVPYRDTWSIWEFYQMRNPV